MNTICKHNLLVNVAHLLGHEVPHHRVLRRQRHRLADGDVDSPGHTTQPEARDEHVAVESPPTASNGVDFNGLKSEIAATIVRLDTQANRI